MKVNDIYTRWKLIDDTNTIYTTEFLDKNGKQIRVGDIIEYKRKKKTGWSRFVVPAGAVVKAQVNEIIVKVKKDYSGTWVLRAICVTARGLNNMPGLSGQSYRIYNTNTVTNITPPIESKDDLDLLVETNENYFDSKSNDDVFSIGLSTI